MSGRAGTFNYKVHFNKQKKSLEELLKEETKQNRCKECRKFFEIGWLTEHKRLSGNKEIGQFCSKNCMANYLSKKWNKRNKYKSIKFYTKRRNRVLTYLREDYNKLYIKLMKRARKELESEMK